MASNKLYRSFIILQEDERGHSVSNDKPLSGYAKIEAKGEKCKIAFYAQNLKSADEKCHMALVCNKKDGNFILDLGLMNINSQGKAEASLEYSTNNIGNLDVSYDKIIGAVIYKEFSGKLVYLMCGFLNGQQPKDNWKVYDILSKHGSGKRSQNFSSNKKVEEEHKKHSSDEVEKIKKESEDKKRSIEKANDTEQVEVEEVNSILEEDIVNEEIEEAVKDNVEEDIRKEVEEDIDVNVEEVRSEEVEEIENRFDEYEESIQARISGGNYEREDDEEYSVAETEREVERIELQIPLQQGTMGTGQSQGTMLGSTGTSQGQQPMGSTGTWWQGQPTGAIGTGQSQGTMTGSTATSQGQQPMGSTGTWWQGQPTGTVGAGQGQGTMPGSTGISQGQQPMGSTGSWWQGQSTGTMGAGQQPTGTVGIGQMNPTGTMHAGYKAWQGRSFNNDEYREVQESDDEFELSGSTAEFFSSVVDNFKYTRNFAKDIKKCKWYKVNVDSFDVLCNMSNYNKYTVAYYPMINYYPYISRKGYFMLGFKYDENGVVKYITYAIPGYKEKNDQPYGGKTGFVTWCPEFENSDNGHWIMFYDFQNSKVLIPII